MPLIAEGIPFDALLTAAVTVVCACVVMLGIAWVAWPTTPYSPRRQVPWQGVDIVLVLAAYLTLQPVAVGLAKAVWAPHEAVVAQAEQDDDEKLSNQHVIGRLMSEGGPWVIALCIISAAAIAPVAEEFVFRVLLQGWLEAIGHRWRRQSRGTRRRMPRGLIPVLATSALFAGMHFRVAAPPTSTEIIVPALAGDLLARCAALLFGIGWIRWRTGATAADFGWAPEKLLGDVKLGLRAFATVAGPVYAMQIGLALLLDGYQIAPDPIPLFFLAMALGFLYFRTHRIVPLIVLHAALNGTSLWLAWLFGG